MSKEVWSRNSEFLHPYISFLVEGMRQMRTLISENKLTSALNYLYWFVPYLDPEIKRKLEEKNGVMRDIVDGRRHLTKEGLYQILDLIMDELHKQGYFAGAKHKIIYVGKEKGEEIEIPEL